MVKQRLSIGFTILLSFSLTDSSSCIFLKPQSPLIPRATPSDLLAVLGPASQTSSVNPLVARQLKSCIKFLVPFDPNAATRELETEYPSVRRHLNSAGWGGLVGKKGEDDDELIWWPPEPVLELARLAFDSGGDPDSIYRALDPSIITVPDAEKSTENKCELTRTPYGRHFISEELNLYLANLFNLIVARGPAVGLNVSLSRYDLFHGHLFIASGTRRLGILFHAKEYPAYDKQVFPLNMGYCQRGSNVTYDKSMNLRNILWLAPLPGNSTKDWLAPGLLVVLDAHPGGIIYRDIVPEYARIARTIYEDDLGDVVVDVNYLNVGNPVPDYQLFIC